LSKPAADTDTSTASTGFRRRIQNASFAWLYRFGGRVYDPLTRFLFGGAWSRWRSAVIPYLPRGRVLDLGCGTGSFVSELNVKGYVAFGVDREPSMLRRVGALPDGRFRFIRGDAGALPFQSGAFDACVATFPSRFILERTTLDEISRVLRPGGTLAIVLSGYTDDWPLRRQPIRLALRLFYGQRESDRLPDGDLIHHPYLSGTWRWASNSPDHVLIWIGTRR
jgi:SAM-dependent methyltransferase